MSNPTEETNEILYRAVEEMEVSVRTSLALQNADIINLGELIQKTEDELRGLNFKERSIMELKEILGEMGLRLGTPLPEWPGRR